MTDAPQRPSPPQSSALPSPSSAFRGLRPEKIVETATQLAARISERFPGSGLGRVAQEVRLLADEAVVRTAAIQRPNIPLRIVIGLFVTAVVAACLAVLAQLRAGAELLELEHFAQSIGGLLQTIVYVGVAILFLITIEVRIKRKRALQAVRELRALAHIVDMHQLTKDPERITRGGPATESSPERSMTPFELGRYLDYCSELLSVISKIGALYVQEFADAAALEAVDHLANLTNGLARNIWQKIMVLDGNRGPANRSSEPGSTGSCAG